MPIGPFGKYFRSVEEEMEDAMKNQKEIPDPPPRSSSAGINDDDGFFPPFFTNHPALKQFFDESINSHGHGGGGLFGGSTNVNSYQIHQDEKEVQIDIDVPGVNAKDLQVHVINSALPSCVVQWSGQRHLRQNNNDDKEKKSSSRYYSSTSTATSSFSNRLRLGNAVDCEQLSATLSQGVLRLSAPTKSKEERIEPVRDIPIRVVERND